MIDYQAAFRKPFTDHKKLLIGILLSMVPILNWFAKGFILESSGLGRTKPTKNMPEWKPMGELFIKGLMATVISVMYMLPATLIFVYGASMTIMGLLFEYLGKVVPIEAVQGLAHGNVDVDTIMPTILNNWPLAVPHIIKFVPILMLAALFGLAAKFMLPIAILSYLKSGQLADAFRFGEVFRKAFTANYFVVWLAVAAVTAIISLLLSIIPLVGPAAAYFFCGVFSYTVFGQVYKEV